MDDMITHCHACGEDFGQPYVASAVITNDMITEAVQAWRNEMREAVARAIFCTRHDPELWGDERFPKDYEYAFREADAAFDAITTYEWGDV